MKHPIPVAFLFICLLYQSCHDNFEEWESDQQIEQIDILVDAEVAGQVKDEWGTPLANCQVTFAGQSVTTDFSGLFYFEAQAINNSLEPLVIEHPDGEVFSQVSRPGEAVHYVQSVLRTTSDQYTHMAGEDHGFSPAADLRFEGRADAFSQAGGQLFQGEMVYIFQDFDLAKPLDFSAIPFGGKVLDPYEGLQLLDIERLFFLEWQRPSGEPLQGEVQWQWEGPTSGASPELWFFNGQEWQRKPGLEQISASTYQAILDQGGYWCLASAQPTIVLSGRLNYENNPVPNTQVRVREDGGGVVATGISDNEGIFRIDIPSGISGILEVVDVCGQVLTAQSVQGQGGSTDIGTLIISSSSAPFFEVQMVGRDCEGKSLSNYFLLASSSSGLSTFAFADSAAWAVQLPRCLGDVIEVQIAQPFTFEWGHRVPWQVDPKLSLGSVFACEATQSEYLAVRIAGERKMYWEPMSDFDLMSGQTGLLVENGAGEKVFQLLIEANAVGAIGTEGVNIWMKDENFGTEGMRINCLQSQEGCGIDELVLTHFADTQGGWIRGYFKGEVWMQSLDPAVAAYRPIEGDFQVYRDF